MYTTLKICFCERTVSVNTALCLTLLLLFFSVCGAMLTMSTEEVLDQCNTCFRMDEWLATCNTICSCSNNTIAVVIIGDACLCYCLNAVVDL